jgi:thiamine-monophosphate kinase
LGEEALIRRIAERIGAPRPPVTTGIGDDCAVVGYGGRNLLLTQDALVEGVHFVPLTVPSRLADPRSVGWRLGAASISDIAAMGGRPIAATVALAVPGEWQVAWLDAVYDGLLAVCGQFGTAVCGGDVVRSDGPAMLSLSLLGEVDGGPPVSRAGARPGDVVCVTGTLGDSRAALMLADRPAGAVPARLDERHLYPMPRVEEGERLRRLEATSMMDLSDGLARDAARLAEASGVGIEITWGALPVSDDAVEALGGRDAARECALLGGEDFELLFTIRSEGLPLAFEALGDATGATSVGRVVPDAGAVLIGRGAPVPLASLAGWQHFAVP